MEISGISTSVNTQGLASPPTTGGKLQPATREKLAPEAVREQAVRGLRGRRGLALGILKQELRTAMESFFRARYSAAANYSAGREAPSVDDVAGETLGAARQVVAEAPTAAAESIVAFREKVQETATYVRETVAAGDDDVDDVDGVIARVENGLDELEGEVANYRESSASVLAVDTRTKQRSTIQIRTQEGDLVRLSLKRVDNLSATDVAYSDGEVSMTSTEVAVSSRSRMVMSVEGDINEAEMAAIQNVFAQAEMIAEEFFGGDIGAAFNVAQGFEFNAEQLARVDLRFRMREVSNVRYAQSVATAPAIGAPEAPAVAEPAAPDVTVPEVSSIEAPSPATSFPAADVQPVMDMPSNEPVPGDALVPNVFSALADFLDALSAFLRTVGEGFETESSAASYTYHYSESFKLSLLKAVVHTIARADTEDAAENATTLIDGVNAADKSELYA